MTCATNFNHSQYSCALKRGTAGNWTQPLLSQVPKLIVGNTTCRTVDTGGHKPRHASNTRAVQVLVNYPTGFPDCVGLVPNSTTTMLLRRTVKALDTGPSSCRMGHNGSDIDSAGTTILISFIHHTSVQSIGTYLLRHLSNIRVVPLSFCFISRLEGDQLNLLCASCNR
jgi:hypothetical protein